MVLVPVQLDSKLSGFPPLRISILSAVLLLACSRLSECQNPIDQEPLEQLNATAGALRLEFRADLEIRALELAKRTDWPNEQKRMADLYDQLSLATVQYPERFASEMQSNTLERITDDSLAFYALDGLSLQMRLLRAVARKMPNWASEKLRDARIRLSSSSCADPSVQTAEPYYSALSDLLFSKTRPARQSDYDWLEEHIGTVKSPIQLIEVAQLIDRIDAPANSLRSLAVALETALQRTSTSDRDMGFLGSNDLIEISVTLLSDRLQHGGVPTAPLWASYRQFLRNGMQQERCHDSITDWHALANHLNNALATNQITTVSHIEWQELEQRTSAIDGHQTLMPSEEQSDALLGSMYGLISARPKADKLFATEDKNDQLRAYMSQIRQMLDQTSSSCELCLDFFKEKVMLSAFDMLRGTALQQDVLSELVTDLASDPSQERVPSLWFLHLQILLNMSRPVSERTRAELTQMTADGSVAPFAAGADSGYIQRHLVESNNPTIQAYVLADRLLGLTFSAPYLH